MDGKKSGFKINKQYAKEYNKFREQEELQKLKARYGDVSEESGSSSSETEDEDAEGLTPKVEKAWLKTLAAIKSKNPRIYDEKEQFYESDSDSSSDDGKELKKSKKKASKPMFLKDYERKVILEKGGIISDEESGREDEREGREYVDDPGYYEEQKQILDSLKEAVESDSADESEEELLTKRDKTKHELKKEEEDYIEWVKGQKEDLDEEAGAALKPLKSYWNDPKLPEGEKFLRDYILNKRYLEEDKGLPTYDDIVDEGEHLSEDEQIEKEELFEFKYNFRFEDPDPEFIKKYPRTINDSVRRKDTKRVDKRKEVKEKKLTEKEKMKEEIKQLKNLKKKEIMNRISKLKKIAGEEELVLDSADLEGDFDPEAHDKLMKKVFSKQYYQQEEDDEKPTWSDDEELGLNSNEWDEWTSATTSGNDGKHANKDDANHSDDDSSHDGNTGENDDDEAGPSSQDLDDSDRELDASKKLKKKSKFQKVIEAKKPVFNPEENTFDEYLEEYYKLDYEDIVAGQTCRFKYRNVIANDFGLTCDEVLSAKEPELNKWVSIKKMSQYRTEEDEKFDVRLYGKKGKNEKNKYNILQSLQEDENTEENINTQDGETTQGKKKRKKRKKKKSNPQNTIPENSASTSSKRKQTQDDIVEAGSKKKTKLTTTDTDTLFSPIKSELKQSTDSNTQNLLPQSDNADLESTVKRKKKKKEKKLGNTDEGKEIDSTEKKGDNNTAQDAVAEADNVISNNKKKKKKKKKSKDGGDTIHIIESGDKKSGKKKKQAFDKGANVMSEERLKAYGIDPKKFKYTQHLVTKGIKS